VTYVSWPTIENVFAIREGKGVDLIRRLKKNSSIGRRY